MSETTNRIRVFHNDGNVTEYYGDLYIYREDFVKEKCIHFRDAEGKHHRIYNAQVIIDEE